ncbi:hypothetical protein H1R17_12825 [Flavobacterium sp. xlx-214]|uniref:hypothetical protein n=1 Tax=unclassified Flavobacterium TaxID=196869 RepID=UPI0013CF81E6|nr:MULTISPECIES: hypothetical protein [unclassified Flavobacterium]MBA5791525.1 hypothetical protein [Flavobacterium sp. xlx-221]QMI83325.1 hypothetical protein H1R17_12825 [Flavobacterium sp. xlx-214]
MIWFTLLVIAGYIVYRFVSALNKDQKELETMSLPDKFSFLVSELNEKAFDSDAKIFFREKRSFYIYLKESYQLIDFFYSTGHLTITWRLKFPLDSEVIYEKQVDDVRVLGEQAQKALANSIIREVETYFKSKSPNAVKYYSQINSTGYLFRESYESIIDLKDLIIGNYLDDNNVHSVNDEDEYLDTKEYLLESATEGLINIINATLKKEQMTVSDVETPFYILEMLKGGNDSFKKHLSTIDMFSENQIEEISSEYYAIVYNYYFKK